MKYHQHHIVGRTFCEISLQKLRKPGRSLRDQFFFFAKDRPKGPPTANRQLPSTANRHQPPTTNGHQPPPTASGDQPPTANHCQPPPTTNHQPPTAANHHQPPPTASCQLPTANRRQLPTANRHQPWLSTWSARGLFWENWFRNTFFFPVKDRPGGNNTCCCMDKAVVTETLHTLRRTLYLKSGPSGHCCRIPRPSGQPQCTVFQ